MSVKGKWLHLATGAGAGRVISFVGNVLLSRLLGPSALGSYNLISTTVQTSEVVVRCGADYGYSYEAGGRQGDRLKEKEMTLGKALTQICTVATGIVVVFVFLWLNSSIDGFIAEDIKGKGTVIAGAVGLLVCFEGLSVSGWEILLVRQDTKAVALRQGLFVPLRVLLACAGAVLGGIMVALMGLVVASILQYLYLSWKLKSRSLWVSLCGLERNGIATLLRRGGYFYLTNLLSSFLFFPLLVEVVRVSGLEEVGYLRVGQVLQQALTFVPATLVPVLFLKLREDVDAASQVKRTEEIIRFIWLATLGLILVYFIVDRYLVDLLFGGEYVGTVLPTRLLLLTTLFECISQLASQPILARGYSLIYAVTQNITVLTAAGLGWLFVPMWGMLAFIGIKMFVGLVPAGVYMSYLKGNMEESRRMLPLAFVTLLALVVALACEYSQLLRDFEGRVTGCLLLGLLVFQRDDVKRMARAVR